MATARELMGKIQDAFVPDNAKGLNKTIQYELTGDDGGTWTASIADGSCAVAETPSDSADVTVTMSASDFVDMMGGKLQPTMAYMSGKLKIKGDMMLAQKLSQFFKFS
jgi:putative sterol carrier protein